MDPAFLADLTKCEADVADVTKSYTAKINEFQGTMRKELSAVLAERQQLCDKVENFWPERFLDADGPVLKHFNGTTDPRVVRAITSFNIETQVNPDGILRKFTIKLKPNIAVASSELFFQVDQPLNVIASSGIEWKQGTEKSQKDSFFRIFDKNFKPSPAAESADRNFLEDVVADFEELYQDPFNDDFSDDEEDFDSEEDYDSEESSEGDE